MQLQQRDAEMRKHFQANLACPLNFQEYATSGSLSRHLQEYKIDEGDQSLLGVGGYAEVRKATHIISGHKVAIKIYQKYKVIDSQVR